MFNGASNFETFDATVIDLSDSFDDALCESIPPSDVPASELPEYEPTMADLLSVETWDDERLNARLLSANTVSAYEARDRELLALREQLVIDAARPALPEQVRAA